MWTWWIPSICRQCTITLNEDHNLKDKSKVVEQEVNITYTYFFDTCKNIRSFTVNTLNIRTDKLRIDVTTVQAWYGRTPLCEKNYLKMSRDMSFPTMWYVRPATSQTSLRIRTVWLEPLLDAWIFYDCSATDRTAFGVWGSKRGCTGSSESTLVEMPHRRKSHVTAKMCLFPHFLRFW